MELVCQEWNYMFLFAYRFADPTTSMDQLHHPPAYPTSLTLAPPIPSLSQPPKVSQIWHDSIIYVLQIWLQHPPSYLEVPMITLIFHIPFRYLTILGNSQPHIDIFLPIKNQAHLRYLLPLRCLIQGKHDWVLYW